MHECPPQRNTLRTPRTPGWATYSFGGPRLGGGVIWDAVDSRGGLELGGGPICFGGCAPGTPLLGDSVVLAEASMP